MVSRNVKHEFYVDMNALRGNRVGTLLTLAADPVGAEMFPPSPGDIVLVRDDEGDLYDARVDALDGIWLGVTIDWASRVPNSAVEPVGQAEFHITKSYDLDLTEADVVLTATAA
jgi:hypothetical protein